HRGDEAQRELRLRERDHRLDHVALALGERAGLGLGFALRLVRFAQQRAERVGEAPAALRRRRRERRLALAGVREAKRVERPDHHRPILRAASPISETFFITNTPASNERLAESRLASSETGSTFGIRT